MFGFRLRYYSPFVTGHIYSLQTYGITFTRFLLFLCLSVHTSPKYFIVSFSTSSFTSTYPFITSIVLSFSSSTSHVLNHLLLTMSWHLHSKSTCISVYFVPHTHRSSSYFQSIPLEPLTGKQPPLTIDLTLAPTLPFAYF